MPVGSSRRCSSSTGAVPTWSCWRSPAAACPSRTRWRARSAPSSTWSWAAGWPLRAAAATARLQHPAWLVIAVPVAAAATYDRLAPEVHDLVAAATPEPFYSVGGFYDDFTQTTDEEVRELLARARTDRAER